LTYALLAAFVTTSANVHAVDTAKMLQDKLAFIAEEKEVVNHEVKAGIVRRRQAEKELRRVFDGDVDVLISKIDSTVRVIVESPECIDLCENAIEKITKGLSPRNASDAGSCLKIIRKGIQPLELQKTPKAMNYCELHLSVEMGTKAIEKLTLREQQLIAEIEALRL
jgi:hypothetical protein